MAWYKSQKSRGTKIPTWSGGTDAEIVAALQAHYAGTINLHDYWTVGDERVVHLSAMPATGVNESHVEQDVVWVLTEVGGKYLSDGVTECAFQWDQKDSLNEAGYMHNTGMNTTYWQGCDRRTWCNSVYKNAIPSTLLNAIKVFKCESAEPNYPSPVEVITTDSIALRSEYEVIGTNTNSIANEGSYIEYYKTSTNRIKKAYGRNYKYWLRSAMKNNSSSYCLIKDTGDISRNSADLYSAIAVFGVV